MISRVTTDGRVTLPKAIRERLGLRAGTPIAFDIRSDDTLRIRVLTQGSVGLFGLLARPGEAALRLDDIDAGIGASVVERRIR